MSDHGIEDDLFEEMPTEADTPVVDAEAGGWADNPFASAHGKSQPGAEPPTGDLSSLNLPGGAEQGGSPATPAAAPSPTPAESGPLPPPARQSGPLPTPARQSGPLPLPGQAPVPGQQAAPNPPTPGSASPSAQQPWGPQVPLPDPGDYERGKALANKLPPPPGYGQQADPEHLRSGGSISYTMDIVLSALEPGRKQRKWIILGAVLVLVGVGVGVWYFGFSGIGDKIDEDAEPQVSDVEMAAPEWEALPTARSEIRSTPAGAAVVLNGVATGELTPAPMDLIVDARNTAMVFAEGHLPAMVEIPADADATDGTDVALTPIGPAPVGWVKVTVLEEDSGADVFVDGVLAGTAPVLVEGLALGAYHHIEVRKEGKAPYVRIFRLEDPKLEYQVPLLSAGTYIDRDSEVQLAVAPPQAKLTLDDTDSPPGFEVRSKGELVQVDATMPGRAPFASALHTTGAGTFDIDVELPILQLGKAQVRWRIKNDDLHPCLVRPGQGFCWREDTDDYLVIDEGQWTLRVYEEDKDGRKTYMADEPTITFDADTRYRVRIEVEDDGRRVVVDDGSPKPWDGED